MSSFSTFLFSSPSFYEGIARLVDFGGMLNSYNFSPTPEQADAVAMASDWQAVGTDIEAAMKADMGEPGGEDQGG